MDKRVCAALAVLEREFRRPVDLAALAASLGLGLSRLEHLFKRDVRKPMRTYVRDLRLREAATLLTTTRMSIGQVGAAIGLPDAANFNHLFKELFAVSPRTYRSDACIAQLEPIPSGLNQIEQKTTNEVETWLQLSPRSSVERRS